MSETAQSLLFTLLDPDSYYPIFTRFCEILSNAEIIALTRTCKRLRHLYQDLLPLQWDVDRTLQRFVMDPQAFRWQMGKHDALISGSIALQFFERVVWTESDLDIYVQDGPNARAMAHYVSAVECYELIETTYPHEYPDIQLVAIQTYTRWQQGKGLESQIQIMHTEGPPIIDIIEGFHSTIVVNFFTHNKAYSLFPKSTFLQHRGYLLKRIEGNRAGALAKYRERGWTVHTSNNTLEDDPYQPVTKTQQIGGNTVWIITFEPVKVEGSTPEHVLELSRFSYNPYGYGDIGKAYFDFVRAPT